MLVYNEQVATRCSVFIGNFILIYSSHFFSGLVMAKQEKGRMDTKLFFAVLRFIFDPLLCNANPK